VKRLGPDVGPLPPSNAAVKNKRICTSAPPLSLRGVHRDDSLYITSPVVLYRFKTFSLFRYKYIGWECLRIGCWIRCLGPRGRKYRRLEETSYMELLEFDVHVAVYRDKFLIIKPTRCTNFSNLFLDWNSTCFGQFLCPSSGVFHCAHSNGICHTGLLAACEQEHFVWHIPLLCVQWKTPDNGQRNCPKHVEFQSKNKFEKLVHLVGFIIREELRELYFVRTFCYDDHIKDACGTCRWEYRVWWEDMKDRHCLKDLAVGCRIILKCILNK